MIPSPFTHSELAQLNPDEQYEETQAADFLMMDDIGTPPSYTSPARQTQHTVPIRRSRPRRQAQPQADKLQFLPLDEWDEHNSYEGDEPSCLHYSIEWKVCVNGRMVSKDTEQDLVLAPMAYWHMFLKPKLEKLLRKKLAQNRAVRCDETNVIVSVTGRSERDLTKRFDDIDIDWSIVEKQLLAWGELFRSGKKLRVDLSFNYLDHSSSANTSARGSKRGSSATQQMLSERAAQLDAEEESSGQPSIWREVYALMQCPGPPCDLGPHCWRDPFGKRHYKLRTHHLRALIEFVEQGNTLQSHEDVPEQIREQLFTEERQRLERQPKAASCSTPFPPINITNVLPQSSQSPMASSVDSVTAPAATSSEVTLDIPGPRDVAVRMYSEWQQSNVVDEVLKTEFQKACDVALDDGLDLEQVYEDQDPGFFVKSGVKRGVARRFVRDIDRWVKRYKLSHVADVSG